ncbi:MAG: multicopper oxidase domain-containing protein [Chloroflexaceae bacterium]|jgi:nitrite reductase (NO-forming)|nr:multicopper oxidase domain-containing protein [Chloroflexaceae bacterium]
MKTHIQHRMYAVTGLLALSLGLAGCGGRGNYVTNLNQPAALSQPAVAAAPQQAEGTTLLSNEVLGTLEFRAFDLGYKPNKLEVEKAGRYSIKLVNEGVMPHDIVFGDGTKIYADAGQTAQGEVVISAAGAKFICSVPGHAAAGMKGEITVKGATSAADKIIEAAAAGTDKATAAHGDDHGGPLPTGDVAEDPNAPPYELFDAAAPALLEGSVHDITLETIEKPMTVAPGFVQQVWTFNGTVPGPVIRVKVGDTVRIRLKNPANSTVPHSVDFHSSQVAWNDEMTNINPGEEKIYEWKADYAGVWMYHCGTAPALHHIANGMYGMVIVEPKEGLPPVDKEFAIVQGEWYLGPQGEVSSLEKAAAAAPAPDLVVFNGVANQYKDHPLQVGTGERVRFFVLNAGPSVDSSFHIVGTIFDTVIKEGVVLSRNNPGNYGSQAVDLAPAQGAIIELTTAEDGKYPIVTHAFNFVGRGALGLLQAGDGEPQK